MRVASSVRPDAMAHSATVVRASTANEPETFTLHDGLSVAEFYAALRAALGRFGRDKRPEVANSRRVRERSSIMGVYASLTGSDMDCQRARFAAIYVPP